MDPDSKVLILVSTSYDAPSVIKARKYFLRHLLPIFLVPLLVACVQENNSRNISLGDVTVGQQLIDLKVAYDSDAISQSEYGQIKDNLIAASRMCASEEEEDDDDDGWLF